MIEEFIVNMKTTPENFVTWLDELLKFNPQLKELDATQTALIKSKLDSVFEKVTPSLYPLNTQTDYSNIPMTC